MIKIFSIKEIIQASTDILNSQNLEKTNTKNTSDGKKKIIPKEEEKQFRVVSKKSKIISNLD